MSLSASNPVWGSTSLPPAQALQTELAASEIDPPRAASLAILRGCKSASRNFAMCGVDEGKNSGIVDTGERWGYTGQTECNRFRTTSCGPRLVNYSSDEDSKSSNKRSSSYIEPPSPFHHRNHEIAISNILPNQEHRFSKASHEILKPISPTCLPSSSYTDHKDPDLIPPNEHSHSSNTTLTSSLTPFIVPPVHPSPTLTGSEPVTVPSSHSPSIRRVIAQQGDQVRLEYYPQWVSRTWARTQMPASLWHEWQTMKEDNESVLTYTPRTGNTHAARHGTARSNAENDGTGMQPWNVLRSEVASDNDSGDYMATMLEETVVLAVRELRSRKIDHVVGVPVEFVSGSQRRAAELLGWGEGLVDVTTFLRLLTTMSARERRKFDGVKVRYMGQVDPRVTETKGRTHRISAAEYLGPVLGEWKSSLLNMRARSFFRDMEVDGNDGHGHDNDDDDEDDDTDQLSEYALLQRYKTLLLNLLTASPWLLHPHSHLTSLMWTMIPRRQLKLHLSGQLGIILPHDWHTYIREQYLCSYSETVQDKRSWHDLMETSLFLNKHFKDLKMAELGQRDEYITDDEGDSDAEDHHPSSGVTAANNARAHRGVMHRESVAMPALSRKRAASAMEDSDPGRITEIEDDDDDDDDGEYDDEQAAYDDVSDSEGEGEAEAEAETESVEPARKPVQRCGPVKSASSKVPRRAAIVDPDEIMRGKMSKTKERNQRLAAKRRMEHELLCSSAQPTEEEWAMLHAMRARQEPY